MNRQGPKGITWTDASWNAVRGCSRVSPGCQHCYAEAQALRVYRCDRGRGVPIGSGSYDGLVAMVGGSECPSCVAQGQPSSDERGEWWCAACIGLGRVDGEARWTGSVRLVPGALDAPLRMRDPALIFVDSMSDLFHESVPFEHISAVLRIPWTTHQQARNGERTSDHAYQILTKRARRMRDYFAWLAQQCPGSGSYLLARAWPLPNVWLGVSAEDQQRYDERIQHLRVTPAAVRFVSLEPLLGPIDLRFGDNMGADEDSGVGCYPCDTGGRRHQHFLSENCARGIDLAIIGGESGKRARPCDVAWIRSLVAQCREAGTKCFIKQDSGATSGAQGRIPNDLWAVKELPDGKG